MKAPRVRAFAIVTLAAGLVACGGSSRTDEDGDAGEGGRASGGTGGVASGTGGLATRGGKGGTGGDGVTGGAAGAGGAAKGGAAGQGGDGGRSGSLAGGSAGVGAVGDAGEGGSAAGAGAGGGSAGTSGEIPEVLKDAIDGFCAAARECCALARLPVEFDCSTTQGRYQVIRASLQSGALKLDEAAIARCSDAYAEGPERCNLNAVVRECRGVFLGQRGVDEPCGDMFDCDRSGPAMTCLKWADQTGLCKTVPHAMLGERCRFTCYAGDNCSSTTIGGNEPEPLCFEDDGVYCDRSGVDPQCRAIVPLGEACDEYDECGSQAYCDDVCMPKFEVGAVCGYNCRRELECSDDGYCREPAWATESVCSMGSTPGP
jgi:hypothetical protein